MPFAWSDFPSPSSLRALALNHFSGLLSVRCKLTSATRSRTALCNVSEPRSLCHCLDRARWAWMKERGCQRGEPAHFAGVLGGVDFNVLQHRQVRRLRERFAPVRQHSDGAEHPVTSPLAGLHRAQRSSDVNAISNLSLKLPRHLQHRLCALALGRAPPVLELIGAMDSLKNIFEKLWIFDQTLVTGESRIFDQTGKSYVVRLVL